MKLLSRNKIVEKILIKHARAKQLVESGLRLEKEYPSMRSGTTSFINSAREIEELMDECGIAYESVDKK